MSDVEKKHEHIYASFIFLGKDLNPKDLTESLGIIPYKSFKRGDTKTETEIWNHGYWELCSQGRIDSSDLTLHIKWIVDQLMLNKQKINETLSDKTIKAKIGCLWIMPSPHEAFILDNELLEKISSLGIPLELDIYSDN